MSFSEGKSGVEAPGQLTGVLVLDLNRGRDAVEYVLKGSQRTPHFAGKEQRALGEEVPERQEFRAQLRPQEYSLFWPKPATQCADHALGVCVLGPDERHDLFNCSELAVLESAHHAESARGRLPPQCSQWGPSWGGHP